MKAEDIVKIFGGLTDKAAKGLLENKRKTEDALKELSKPKKK